MTMRIEIWPDPPRATVTLRHPGGAVSSVEQPGPAPAARLAGLLAAVVAPDAPAEVFQRGRGVVWAGTLGDLQAKGEL